MYVRQNGGGAAERERAGLQRSVWNGHPPHRMMFGVHTHMRAEAQRVQTHVDVCTVAGVDALARYVARSNTRAFSTTSTRSLETNANFRGKTCGIHNRGGRVGGGGRTRAKQRAWYAAGGCVLNERTRFAFPLPLPCPPPPPTKFVSFWSCRVSSAGVDLKE